jgi:hypothetical protein
MSVRKQARRQAEEAEGSFYGWRYGSQLDCLVLVAFLEILHHRSGKRNAVRWKKLPRP